MIDNTHVVVLRGTGREMVPVLEMAAFAERFNFCFVAHERGDANRSARVERPFWFIENNFLAGRTFSNGQTGMHKPGNGAIASTPPIKNISAPFLASCLPLSKGI
jgi:hypothetical protein